MKIKENKVSLECILFGMHSFLAICEVLAYNEKNGNGALIGVIDMKKLNYFIRNVWHFVNEMDTVKK